MQPSKITEILNRPISQELLGRDLTRLAYVARDGTPRSIPIAFVWNGAELVMCTTKNAPKLAALRQHPMVALTIDTEVHPPKILLIRGRAELDYVDGIPDEYLSANSTYAMTPEQRVEWEAEVRSLYHDGMVRIVVTADLGEADRLRDDAADRGRGAGPRARGAAVLMAKFSCSSTTGVALPTVEWPLMDQWMPDEVDAHLHYMRDFGDRLRGTGRVRRRAGAGARRPVRRDLGPDRRGAAANALGPTTWADACRHPADQACLTLLVRAASVPVSAVAIAAVSVGSDSVRFAHWASVDQLRRREEHPRTPSRPRSR